jgi:lipoate-protein ligase A
MAADEVLLAAAVEGVASLRFYAWDPPTLSLGYFQRADERLADPRLAALPFVRRASGGGALVHHHEVTYALALPPGSQWQAGEPWPCRMHHIIQAALADLGVAAATHGCAEEREAGAFLCFRHQTPGDLLAGDFKVVGSAQRRQRGAILQHGGILLAASEYAPHLPGLRELAGVNLAPTALTAAVCDAFRRATGWSLAPSSWRPGERERVAALAAEKYGRDAWNRKR